MAFRIRISIVSLCLVGLFALFSDAEANEEMTRIALNGINSVRGDKNLSQLKLDDKLSREASQCAEYFGRIKKFASCPYYDHSKTAYLSFYTSSVEETPEELVDSAYALWNKRGTIRSGMGSWFKRFGVGIGRGSSGSYVVALMS